MLKKETDQYGKEFDISLKIINNSSETRTFSGCINTSSMYYTGIVAKRVKKLFIEKEKIGSNKSEFSNYFILRMGVDVTEYLCVMNVFFDLYNGTKLGRCNWLTSIQYSFTKKKTCYFLNSPTKR